MKKLFLLAAMVGVALTGCMKNEVYVPKCETPISFEVANYVAQTRAGVFATTEKFGVDAWSYNATAGTVQIMEDELVSYDDVNDQWAPSQTYYWPIDGTVDFIAYYPATSKPDNISYNYDGTDAITYSNYTVTDVDLMYADKAIRYSQNVTGYNGFTGVPTLFRHALAKVNFQVQNALPVDGIYSYDIKVNSITLNAYNTGSVTLKTDATATDATATRGTWSVDKNVWTPSGNIVEIATWSAADVTLSDGNDVAYDATRLQYVLPQTLEASKQNVVVNYTVTQYQTIDSVKTKIAVNTYEKDAYLYSSETGANNRWEMNKNITYTISLKYNGNPILFAPAVEDWVDADGSPVTIQ